ncbi:3',5'-cyclic-nucleotide phosphodiesterase [Legionella lansingensis]|uniref:3',5'-cyclic adenosine monophosphate phosphodiesterase CpdA n=1 Tax=Legionella lansingensis TaxID=45067 RepID=A0A0W0VT66_9GAMM|nr:metallophosphoesterase [Legionella lansingensis]KTD23383.1 3',5'-cyclic adenosine monophosphate phosphodiesterase CpdA [Legionella lansingensis]SNV49473.1 3',5'-cyclic-nucleotide phosphodiesterase [Legionella lansingensis]
MSTNSPITLVQLSDLHFSGEKPLKNHPKLPAEGLANVLKHIETTIPEEKIIILTGDLVADPDPALYQELASIFRTLPHTVAAIPGNHDSFEMMKEHFFGYNISSKTVLSIGKWLNILLDSSHSGLVKHSGRIINSDLEMLENTLTQHPNQHILIFLHHPPIAFGSEKFKKIILENAADFNSIVQRFEQVKAVIFGHAHTEFSLLRQKILYLSCPSTWAQFDRSQDDLFFMPTPSAYNSYRLYDDGSFLFMTHYCWS